jgi:NADPH:quinone reductase-like Zn-dependent oxidoreductase
MRAVRFQKFGGTEVLSIDEVARPIPDTGQVLVRVIHAALNPLDSKLRSGQAAHIMPTTFPSGQGFEMSGEVVEIGSDVYDFAAGDKVFGFAPRRAQADYVVVDTDLLALKPDDIGWAVAASIPTAGSTAYAAIRAVAIEPGETVVVSAAAGGMGNVVTQLAINAGARVIATASAANFDYLTALGATPVEYGPGLVDRIRGVADSSVDAYLDNFGDNNVTTAVELGIKPSRINTIVDFAGAAKHGARTAGQSEANSPEVWAEIVALIVGGKLTIPVHAVHPVEHVRAAYDVLETGHTRGKIALSFQS